MSASDPLTDLDFAPCLKCVADSGPHPWHDDGTSGLRAEDWETGGKHAAPGHVEDTTPETISAPAERLTSETPSDGSRRLTPVSGTRNPAGATP